MTEPLSRGAILTTAETVLRQYGPAKTTVLDVARALDVSHGSVYRHFASKAALRDAVTERWLDRISAPLERLVETRARPSSGCAPGSPCWPGTKQAIARDEPELFATFRRLTDESREVVGAHVDHLAGQISRIVAEGVAAGELAAADPEVTGRAVLQATALFHHPAHAEEWADPQIGRQLEAVLDVVVDGLRPRT